MNNIENKEIEEIADILCESKNRNCNGGEDCKCLKQAKDLYNAGCRIVKDKAVLTRREWYQIGYKDAAREIYEQLCGHGTTYVKKWIKEQFGVEAE